MFPVETKFLVVDDTRTMRKIVTKVLHELEFKNVEEANDGRTALPKLKAAVETGVPFDFVISDWNMPDMSGLDLLEACRSEPKLKNILFMLVTAEGEQTNFTMAIQSGVTDYIMKPFTAVKFKAKLERIYERKQKYPHRRSTF